MKDELRTHWERVYAEKSDVEVSWHQDIPEVSLELADEAGIDGASAVIDIGGGTSRFVDGLIERGVRNVTVLDLSEHALAKARDRLGSQAATIRWIAADVTRWTPDRDFDLWHDRAVFHFLTEPADRAAYLDRLSAALQPGAHAVIATFAPDGPERCSGLPVIRYSAQTLSAELGDQFHLVTERYHRHVTPWGSAQSFQFNLFRKA